MEKKKILLVDDDVELCEELIISLNDRGYEVVSARSGEDAMDRLQEGLFDIVLMDIKMSGMGGIKASQEIKQAFSSIPIIIITGALPSEVECQLKDIPTIKVLYKTFDIESLINEVEKLLEGQD